MRLQIMEPGGVWGNANHLHRGRYGQIESNNEGLRFGTLVRLGQAEEHPVVCARYPVIRDTLMLTSSRQMRNMATIGGSLLQRNRYRGMPRKSRSCIATRSSDLAQALIALGATVDTIGASSGPRRIELAALHCKSGETEDVAAALQPGELITFVNIPAGPWTRRSRYLKIALASAAVAVHMEGNKVIQARVAVGGVAAIPRRSPEAEAILNGHILDESLAARAAAAAFAKVCTAEHESVGIPLGKRVLIRALLETRAMQI